MIDKIEIKNFKGIRSLSLPCKYLTLFAGANGAGKSTVIQSLLLLLQTEFSFGKGTIFLNGRFIQLGSAEEIEYNWSEGSEIEFGYTAGNQYLNLKFKVELADDRDVIDAHAVTSALGVNFAQRIKYLSAHRIAPDHIYPHSTHEISNNRSIGIFGEFTFAFLSKFGEENLIISALMHPNAGDHGVASSLVANITAWMQKISPGLIFKAELMQDIGSSRVSYSYPGLGATPSLSSRNVGFGITNVLPVVTRILMSKPEDILILENPEAHVHPKGQVELGKLIAAAADNGVQIFLETHSDHVFNGIRLAFKDSPTRFDNCAMYYVARETTEKEEFETKLNPILLTERGKIREAPLGFFDEWENSIMELL